VENYPDGSVKGYNSDVSVVEGDKEVKRQVVMVNHPLTYKGVSFYQSTYGIGEFTIKVTPAQGAAEELTFPVETGGDPAGPYSIPEANAVQFIGEKQAALVGRGFSPTGPDDSSCPVTGTGTGGASEAPCAAAQLTLVSGFSKGGNHSFKELGWIKQGQPMKAGSYTLELEPVHYYTGLTARRDYGVPLVWLGFALLTGGLMATFYFKPHTLVARVTSSDAGQQVTLAAFEKGGAGQERWQERPYPVIGQILGSLEKRAASAPGSGAEGREEEEDEY
jgi:cytochrome c biogenesis protein